VSKQIFGPTPSLTILPFTHPYPHGTIEATLAVLHEALRDGQSPHGWLFQARWTMVRNGVGERQHGGIHAQWPGAAHDKPTGSTNHEVVVCIGSRDNLAHLFALGRLREPTPERVRRPC
jgi:hypothetical protein